MSEGLGVSAAVLQWTAKRTLDKCCWWARQDSNLQPDRYERPALTIELQARRRAAGEGSAATGAAILYSLARDPAMAPRPDAFVGVGPLLYRYAGELDHLAPP